MVGPPADPPETDRFDEYYELAVDGESILRLEEISDLKKSPVHEAVVAQILLGAAEDLSEELEDEHGKTPEEIVEEADPEIKDFDSSVGEWE